MEMGAETGEGAGAETGEEPDVATAEDVGEEVGADCTGAG